MSTLQTYENESEVLNQNPFKDYSDNTQALVTNNFLVSRESEFEFKDELTFW